MNKWLSRKLLVAIVSVVAIAFGILRNDPDVETTVISTGEIVVSAAIGLISTVYIIAQGRIDNNVNNS